MAWKQLSLPSRPQATMYRYADEEEKRHRWNVIKRRAGVLENEYLRLE
jgi:hypothetical protein